ncbi:hypothetical protein SLEP1_g35041 [Rubroshorea leprosula]|uniref:Reverse transcriptase Ty1/copia-type domain-containing protein n=1 Tax=Rubroshorea leprosula TaxID=152421 RepID=A0AAV5KLZ3_9ROSI|nr:hypothetical protein SLEP1_g35041 [Rubroshorea leprosula]
MFSLLSNFQVSSFDQPPFFTNPSVELFPSDFDAGTSDELYNASLHALTSSAIDDLLASNALDNSEPASTSSSVSPVDGAFDIIESTNELIVPSSSRPTWMDVTNAFVNGDLKEEVYLRPPPRLNHPPNKKFEMKDLGVLSYFLGLEVTSSDDGYQFSQVKYASDLISKVELNDNKSASTPLEPNVKLTPMDDSPLSNHTRYWELVGSLVYLTATRPNIAYAVHIVSQFTTASRSTRYLVVLRIIRYIKGTLFHRLHFYANSSSMPHAYSDADWVGDPFDRKSTTSYLFSLVIVLSFVRARNKLFHLVLALKLSIELLAIQHQNFFHYGGFLKIWHSSAFFY